jgi:integrase
VQTANHLIGTAPGKRRVVVANNGFVLLSENELLCVLRTAKSKAIRDWAMILTTYSHGLRAAETCGLKICDLDLRGGVLSIHRLKGSLFTIQGLERHRGIPLLDEVRALREWLAVRPTDCGDAQLGMSEKDYNAAFILHWAKDASMAQINARSETLHERAAFKENFERRR